MVLVCNFFTVAALQGQWFFTDYFKLCNNRFIIGNAFRIKTFNDTGYVVGNLNHPFFGNQIILNCIEFCMGGNQRNFIYFIIGKKFVGYFNYGFASQFPAFQVGSKSYLVINFIQA